MAEGQLKTGQQKTEQLRTEKVNIWLINPFSDLPNESASERRFCCLARVLVEQGHRVIWWTVDEVRGSMSVWFNSTPDRDRRLLPPLSKQEE